jgi:hypothetical protein
MQNFFVDKAPNRLVAYGDFPLFPYSFRYFGKRFALVVKQIHDVIFKPVSPYNAAMAHACASL